MKTMKDTHKTALQLAMYQSKKDLRLLNEIAKDKTIEGKRMKLKRAQDEDKELGWAWDYNMLEDIRDAINKRPHITALARSDVASILNYLDKHNLLIVDE